MTTPNTLYKECTGLAPIGGGQYAHVFSLKLVLGETVDQQANTSVVPWSLYLFVNKSDYVTGYTYSGGNMVTVQIGGQNVFSRQNVGRVSLGDGTQAGTHYESNPVLLASGTTQPITHNNDGKKTISVVAKYEQASASYLQQIYLTANVDLTSITRAATIATCPDVTLIRTTTVNHKIEWTDVNQYYYKVQYLYGNTILHTSSAIAPETEEYIWAMPGSVAENEIHSKTMQITVALHTYTDSACTNELGVNARKFTATMGVTYQPQLNQATVAVTPIDFVNGTFVAGKSTFSIEWSTVYWSGAEYGSGYAVYIDSNGNEIGERITGALPLTLNPPMAFTDVSKAFNIRISETDSRGFTNTVKGFSSDFPVYGWATPSITDISAVRCDSDGTENERGYYFKATITYSIRALDDTNAKTATVKYKWLSDNNYTQADTGTLTAYSGTAALGPYQLSNPQDEKLEIMVQVGDSLTGNNPAVAYFTINPAHIFIDILTAGRKEDEKVGLGVGIVADEQNAIRSKWKTKLWDVPIEIYDENGNLRVSLDYTDGLQFFDSSGNVTKQYPVS